MARFMLSTLQALLSGDISPQDACYTISAHLAAVKRPEGSASQPDGDIQPLVKAVIHRVLAGHLTAEQATNSLVALSEHFSKGLPISEFSLPSS